MVIRRLLNDTLAKWREDKASRLGAALAFYTMFSLAPLFVLVVAVAGLLFGQRAVEDPVYDQVRRLVGPDGAAAIREFATSARAPKAGLAATLFGVVMLLFGATGVFGQLQDAINTVWGVAPRPGRGIRGVVKDRFISFAMVLGIGFLLIVSLVVDAVLSVFGAYLALLLPKYVSVYLLGAANLALSFAIVTVLLALIYKVLPDAHVHWNDVWAGAAITALLFSAGRLMIGLYIGNSQLGSAYGVAGSVIIVMIWVFYSSQIVFFGAEFTYVYARLFGSRIEPASNAVPITDEARADQGIPRAERVAEAERQAPPSAEHA